MRTLSFCFTTTLVALSVLACTGASRAFAQSAPATPEAQATSPTADKPPLKQEELDQLLAPIALYPDALVSQILMACTYPLEVVEASRWEKQNKLTGDAMGKALEAQTWDASVKSLVNFPQVLDMLNEKLDMTTKIGDAFIGQQKEVLDTIQSLRAKAKAAGNLESNEQQKVEVQQAGATQTIIIEQANPDVIYVPTYNPTVVYGTWPYPAYPPYYYYPPSYHPGTAAVAFGVGVACGLAWGYACGNCNWGHGNVDIDINQNINRNTNIDRNKINANSRNGNSGKGQWKHDPAHRQGVAYRNQATARQYGRGSDTQAAQSREQYRGRAEQGRQDIDRQGINQNNVGQGGQRDGQRGGQGASTADRGGGAGSGNRGASPSTRDAGNNAFSGSDRGGQATRDASNRGSSSRSASPSPSNRSSSGSRSSGGGSRGGGGGRGGGGRR